MKRIVAALCCVLLGCMTMTWRHAASRDIHEGSELFFVGTDRAVQIRNAHPSGDRVQGDVVHMWRLPPGPMSVPVMPGDEPLDIARRGGWQEFPNAPAVFVGDAREVDRVRATEHSHFGRDLLHGLAAFALLAVAFAYAFTHGVP